MKTYYLWDSTGGMFCVDAADETQEFISRCEDLRTRALDEWYDVDSELTFVRCLGVV